MVVATQKGRQYPTLNSACSNDSLARSLHKEMGYSPVNVSRRSPDQQHMGPSSVALAPDSRYPMSGQRKRQNTLLDTGWHTCFKNNNYVFVRNSEGFKSERRVGDKWKENNDTDVTYVISTTKPIKAGHEGKLIVSLQDPKPKITKYSPPRSTPPTTPSTKTPKIKESTSTTIRSKKSDKKTMSWLKRLRTPGRNRSVKVDASAEETTPIFGATSDDSPDSTGSSSKVLKTSESPEMKILDYECSPLSADKKKEHDISLQTDDTPALRLNYHLQARGPQTSTPKKECDSDRNQKLPRSNSTPYKLGNGKLSVRRRLPYEQMTSEGGNLVDNQTSGGTPITKLEDFQTSGCLDIPISPIQKKGVCRNSGQKVDDSDIVSSINRIQRRRSCLNPKQKPTDKETSQKTNLQRRLSSTLPKSTQTEDEYIIRKVRTEPQGKSKKHEISPQRESLLHPSPSNDDIPFVDYEEEVSFDDKPRRRLIVPTKKEIFLSKSTPDVSLNSSCVDGKEVRSLPDMKPISSIISSEIKAISFSEPAISPEKNTYQAHAVRSPMEEEENLSLDLKTEDLISSQDATLSSCPYSPEKEPPIESPLSCWLKEIRLMTDNECLNALQAKALLKEDWVPNALAVGNAQESAERVWDFGTKINKHIEDMIESLKTDKTSSEPLSLRVAQLCTSLVEIIKLSSTIKQLSQIEAKVRISCAELLAAVKKNGNDFKSKMKEELESIQKHVLILIQQLILRELFVIVDCVERAANIENLKRAVFALILLGRVNPTLCELMGKLGTVRSLLSICVEEKWRDVHPCVLRALTVLSCVPSTIRSFEENGGVDCVCDVLCENKSAEEARSEAAGLVAQITAPWTEGSGYVLRSISNNAERLVKSIASLASATENSEVFLLSSAALANLSFTEDAIKKMKENKVLEILVDACRNKPHAVSLFIKDQVATVLANMAAKDDYRESLCSGGSLVLLMCFLQLRPSAGHGPPQLAACERVQQKAAIAIARLCTNPSTSNIVAEMQGIQRLVKLCKDRKERNDSDSVLVACLAALRKIAAVRQKEEFTKLGAQELVEPRLWDAFLAHSSKRESYV